jgi:hypothetical protein
LTFSQRDPFEIQLYTVGEIAAIMAAAEKNAPGLVPFLAVSFFCGIRRAEAMRSNGQRSAFRGVHQIAGYDHWADDGDISAFPIIASGLAPYATERGECFFSDNVLRDRLGDSLWEKHGLHGQTRIAPRPHPTGQLGFDISQLCGFLAMTIRRRPSDYTKPRAWGREARSFGHCSPKPRNPEVVAFQLRGGMKPGEDFLPALAAHDRRFYYPPVSAIVSDAVCKIVADPERQKPNTFSRISCGTGAVKPGFLDRVGHEFLIGSHALESRP